MRTINRSLVPLMVGLLFLGWACHSIDIEAHANTTSQSPLQSVLKNEEKQEMDKVADDWDQELRKSQCSYRLGHLLIKPHAAKEGINELSVYQDRKLILRRRQISGLRSDTYMWLTFPYLGRTAKLVHTFDGGRDDFIPKNAKPAKLPFIDLNGDKVPEVVLTSGSNGGNTYEIYSLGTRARLLTRLETVPSDAAFMDVDHDGKFEVLTYDPAFFGWNCSNAESAVTPVILKLQGHKLLLATSLMKTKPPTLTDQRKLLAAWSAISPKDAKHESTFYLSPQVWTDMLELTYSGNSKLAFELLDKFWQKGYLANNIEGGVHDGTSSVKTSKTVFKRTFLQQLATSPYLPGIKILNRSDRSIQRLRQRPCAFLL